MTERSKTRYGEETIHVWACCGGFFGGCFWCCVVVFPNRVSQSTLLWSVAAWWGDVVRGPAGEARQSWLAPLRPGQEQQLLRG